MSGQLDFRIASDADFSLLCQYRRECGWGEPALKRNWSDPDRIFCVFEASINGIKEDVGMACWLLHQPDDLGLADKDKRVVHLASLFIQHRYQGFGFGSKALSLLEKVAVERYGAETVTLDTAAYYTSPALDGPHHLEDPSRQGRTVGWYIGKGYSQFRPNRKLFPDPSPDDPDRLLTAIFMHKPADAIRQEMAGNGLACYQFTKQYAKS